MSGNTSSYIFSSIFVLIAHIGMLLNVYFNGNYDSLTQVIILSGAVIILDIAYLQLQQSNI